MSKYITNLVSKPGAIDSIIEFSVLSNPAGTHNLFCLGLCGRYLLEKINMDWVISYLSFQYLCINNE